MATPHPIPPDLAELLARRLRLVGDATRIRILDHLRSGEASVGELTEALDATQQNISKHLCLLAEAGIVERRKAGTRALYSIADEGVFRLCDEVCASAERSLEEAQRVMNGYGR